MSIQIPHNDELNTNALSRVFKDTVATYKYYWFISLLNIFNETGKTQIPIWDMVISMISNAWYPIHYFRLSFGKSDSMYSAIREIREITDLPIDADVDQIQSTLKKELANHNKELKKTLRVFTLNVPYRFLMPWIRTSDNKEMVERSLYFENGALYSLEKDNNNELIININPVWEKYLTKNYEILLDYTYWNLTNFLQARNPNVPNIPNKLVRPKTRKSLSRQHRFWNSIIELSGPVKCIYTGKPLYKDSYDLDHFIPWSFVTHDLSWNLLPSESSINSSKSDKIPELDLYLPKLAATHQNALKTFTSSDRRDKASLLEDYLSLGYSIPDLLSMEPATFYDVFYHTISPIAQIALNMGFELWKNE